jgi:hypothetical protein
MRARREAANLVAPRLAVHPLGEVCVPIARRHSLQIATVAMKQNRPLAEVIDFTLKPLTKHIQSLQEHKAEGKTLWGF